MTFGKESGVPRGRGPKITSGPPGRALEFLRVAHLYRLGNLTTEQPNPETRELSRWARRDLPRGVSALKAVDLSALGTLEGYAGEIDRLTARVQATLAAGRRVFLCGCGATGRLALSLEFLWRQRHGDGDRVLAFMAGGDTALAHALEGFEDYPAHGARHLREMGFADGDLLIACTEGGETPYVLGATTEAAELSSNPPCLLYCNADAVLTREVERFRLVHDDPRIDKLCLCVGPMALAGSTRMQASTVLQLAVGLALLHPGEPAAERIAAFRRRVRDCDLSFLPGFIEREAGVYAAGGHVIYRVADYGITVFTDTTERAPTFSLAPFDRCRERRGPQSLCYVVLDDAGGAAEAWTRLLGRPPRPLEWPEVDPRTTLEYLIGFDFSVDALTWRRRVVSDRGQHEFHIRRADGGIRFRFEDRAHVLAAGDLPVLFQHLLLKQVLNIHSTLVMGRLGRYQGNLMTWVQPTNNKLVDRAARYVMQLLSDAGRTDHRYEDVVCRLFVELERIRPGRSVVLETLRSLLRSR